MTPTPMPHEGINAFDGKALLIVLLICGCVVVVGYILTAWQPEDVLDAHDQAEQARREADAGSVRTADAGRIAITLLVAAAVLLLAGALAGCDRTPSSKPKTTSSCGAWTNLPGATC